jgi:hypothetical protein
LHRQRCRRRASCGRDLWLKDAKCRSAEAISVASGTSSSNPASSREGQPRTRSVLRR